MTPQQRTELELQMEALAQFGYMAGRKFRQHMTDPNPKKNDR